MQNMQNNMQNMSEHKTLQVYPKICKICNKYAKYVSQNLICRICTPHFADDATQLHKPQSFEKEYQLGSSVAEWLISECFRLGSKVEKSTFCWIGFCARDDEFKHSEAKWCQLPWLLSETLLTTCRLTLQCTKVERSPIYLGERFESFAKLQSLQLLVGRLT